MSIEHHEKIKHFAATDYERFSELVNQLDPLGLWRAKHSGIMEQCLHAIDHFYGVLAGYASPEHQSLVTDALFLAFKAHGLEMRKSKDALFFEHPLAVAEYLARYRLDAPTLAAALLHDVAEDTTVSISQIVERFGSEVGILVEGVTRLQATGKQVVSHTQRNNILVDSTNKLFQFMIDDVRVVLIKLADRRHNMYTLDALPRKKQEEKAHEVLRVYAPLAYRLGIWDVKSELEELALKVLYPVIYRRLVDLMRQRLDEQEVFLDYTCRFLAEQLNKTGLDSWIEPSPEHIYSLFLDYKRSGRVPLRLPDTIRITVLVQDRCDCYRALCVTHDTWRPVPGTFDDYIAQPRENLYRALHTTVLGPGGRLLKVRFRTNEMHEIAHHGILARWCANISDPDKDFETLQRLMNRLRPVIGIPERAERLTAFQETLTDQIQVFTPEGELVELPAGSTPLDFAYQIHTKLGDEARGASINGTKQSLNTRLKNGDQVSIERKRGRFPRREWLDEDFGFVTTVYARNHIRRAFRRFRGEEAVKYGREAIQQEMNLMGVQDFDLEAISAELEYPSVKDLLISIARADIVPSKVAHIATRPFWEAANFVPNHGEFALPGGAIEVKGLPGRPVRLCGSCKPTPGDPVLGNLLRGGQVTVHRLDCHHITNAPAGVMNLVEVDWVKEATKKREIHIRAAASDRSGLTFGLARILELEHINIQEMYARTSREHRVALISVTAEITDLRQLSRILHRFAQIPNVKAVQRISEAPHYSDDSLQWAIKQVRRR